MRFPQSKVLPTPLFGLLMVATLVALVIGGPGACFAQAKADAQPNRVTPEPRRQGVQAWRRLPPEQREQIRDRFREDRQRGSGNGGQAAASRDREVPRRLTPEERQALRDEISAAHVSRNPAEVRPRRGERSGRGPRK